MAITVNFKTKNGEKTNRKFELNEGVSIYGKFTGVLTPEPFTFYRIEVTNNKGENVYYKEGNANVFGDYDGYFKTPDLPQQLEVKVNATYSVSGSDETIINIACGGIEPKRNPDPETEKSFLDFLPLILIIFLGAFLYLTFIKSKV